MTLPEHQNLTTTENDAAFLNALSIAGIKGAIKTHRNPTYYLDIVPWNLRCQFKPLALVYAESATDVSLAVKVAAQFSISVQPRSGGHSFGSYSLGGKNGALIVDLKHMNTIKVDPQTHLASIGGGARLGQVTKDLYSQEKRAIAHGTCPQVGIGGHATIGGQGPLSRMWGLTLDHVKQVEVVLADGSIVTASDEENSDLFWAIRGAGASFAIVTTFIFETHPAPTTCTHYSFQMTAGTPSALAAAFTHWQTLVSSPLFLNDRAFNSVITVTKCAVTIQGTRYGSRAELEKSEIHLQFGEEWDVRIWELDWLASTLHWAQDELYTIAGGISSPLYIKNLVVRQSKPLTAEAIEAWFDYIHKHARHDAFWAILADLEGGRISDFPNSATAYAQRDALYTLAAYSVSVLPFPDTVLAFMNGMVDAIRAAQPDADFGAYPGYVDPLLPKSEWPTQYWGANYSRLVEIKNKYDPLRIFSNPQSVGS